MSGCRAFDTSTPLLRGAIVALLLVLVSLLASPPVLASPDGPVWSVDNEAEWVAATENAYRINMPYWQLEITTFWAPLWENTTEFIQMGTSYLLVTTVGTWEFTHASHRRGRYARQHEERRDGDNSNDYQHNPFEPRPTHFPPRSSFKELAQICPQNVVELKVAQP
ncbi:unnamed protein product [marine sediment metagenome]|uniref:Uncharacterized protein n=1 Tax=marine sediment metagenome TaxID=412755 RepID=X1LYJ8_9ZZZZ